MELKGSPSEDYSTSASPLHVSQRFKTWCRNYFENSPKPLSGLTLGELSKKENIYHYCFKLPETNRVLAFEKMVPAALNRELAKSWGVTLGSVREQAGFNIENNKINLFSGVQLSPKTIEKLQEKFELTKRQVLSTGAKLVPKKEENLDDFVQQVKSIPSLEDKAKAILENRSVMDLIAQTLESFRGRKPAPETPQNLNRKAGLSNGIR